ncbi:MULTISPECIES: hypothetical protein [unclassified Helicobacter]|uniref:hypothetical protein n=1 Tax=unclassified Helicobacter TaxID=2593540 RepID=UPI000A9DDB1B|nr:MULTISPECIES: hypothetical protein [unclassified Helicobacter]
MADSKRREFIKTSAKMGALALGAGLASASLLNAESGVDSKDSKNSKTESKAESKTNSKIAQNSANNTKTTKGAKMKYITLNNGVKMPMLGFGTFQITDLKEA